MQPGSPPSAHRARAAVAIAAVAAAALTFPAGADEPAGAVTILDGSSPWRVLYSWAAPLVKTDDGVRERRVRDRRGRGLGEDFRFMTQYPPTGWTGREFDDAAWARRHFFIKYANGEIDSRAGGGAASPALRQLCLRGKFTVTDPDKVRSLRLTIRFRGGAVAYLNGRELTRAHMPAGDVRAGAPAEMYPLEVYLKAKGKPWSWFGDRAAIAAKSYARRPRAIEGLAIPRAGLRKGTNVLAVEIHAAPFPAPFADPKCAPSWATCGLIELRLQADGPDGLVANVDRPAGLQVWNTSILAAVYDATWADPHETLGPVQLAGARNGCCTARVALGSDAPIRRPRAAAGELTGPGGAKIAASAVQVRYGVFDGIGARSDAAGILFGRIDARRDDGMVHDPPEEVPLRDTVPAWPPAKDALAKARRADGLPPLPKPAAVLPVYLTVRIPRDAPPGQYSGELTISAEGHRPVAAAVNVRVIDWTLPDPRDFQYWCGMIQSLEGVAMPYGVPLWTDEHWALIDRSLSWVAQVGSKVLFVPLGAESEYGNARSMVLWHRVPGGGYTHDFSRVEKYLDLALKRLGKPRFVVVGVWQFCEHKKRPLISVLDPATGKIENVEGPVHGSDESLAFWRPVLTKIHDMLRRRGLGEAMLLGYISDRIPSKQTVGVFHRILPEVGWQGQRHWPRGTEYVPHEGGRKPVKYQSNVWGCGQVVDPATRRVYGWKYGDGVPGGVRTWLDRGVYDPATLTRFRGMSENILLSDRPGQGQIGADFWPPPAAKGAQVRLRTLYSRFPRSRNVGAGNKGITSNQMLYPGPDGPVATIRFEMLREGIQECEARIFLEKLLTADPCPLPAELARKCQALLDERTRWQRVQNLTFASHLSWPHSGWEQRTARLFEAAGEAERAAKGR